MANPPNVVAPRQRTRSPKIQDPQPVIPSDIRTLLGPAPLTSFEDVDAYERVLSQMAQAVAPTDFVEWTWLKDIVDLGWEAGRARRAKAVRLTLARRDAIENILRADWPAGPGYALERDDAVQDKAYRILHREEAALRFFGLALAKLGLTEQSVSDAAYHEALGDMARLQQLIDNANARRDAVLREIDRRRDSLAKRLRGAVEVMDPIIDGEFE